LIAEKSRLTGYSRRNALLASVIRCQERLDFRPELCVVPALAAEQ